ncbi:Juvenile hormone-inducible protein [Culex quinquefasciatus]|uniref:Juvenile hormone-inducible protein n=1 Tax=Culex quinquefasciatus TaxID=7176 RepID=B0X5P0_CULQU|nr:Juvenile hormone-inducible protein [Culex quinquefasciatus]|eukprot:XP_001864962.1 Juvenile hormone-inducible protein [Culex quinquefasciatus]
MTTTTPAPPLYVRSKLEQIVRDAGFVEFRIEYEPGSKQGDGFIGQILRARIRGDRRKAEDGSVEKGERWSLICKYLLDDPVLREKFNSMVLFEREVFVYREVLPEFERFQLERGLVRGDGVGFWNYLRCYWAGHDEERGESVLILEDLAERRMVMKDKYVPTDFEHTQPLMVALGKLNACSFAIKQQRPEVFDKIRKLDYLMHLVMSTEQTAPLAARNCKLAASLFTGAQRDRFLALQHNLWEKARQQVAPENLEPYAAFNHGDCWINNVMYGYDASSGAVNDLVLFDWQMANCGPPTVDLHSFVHLCGRVELRREKLPTLLDAFYDAFAGTFRRLGGGDPEQVLPRDVVPRLMNRFGGPVFAMGVFGMPILCQLPEEFFQEDEEGRGKEQYRESYGRNPRLGATIITTGQLISTQNTYFPSLNFKKKV